MRQVIVGTFDRQAAARAAIIALANERIDPRRVHAIETQPVGAPGEPPTARPPREDHLIDHLRNFFAGLFGIEHDVTSYAAAMRRGGAVVRVDAEDPPEALRAEQAFAQAGAIDITRRCEVRPPR